MDDNSNNKPEYGGFWIRFVAFIIDNILLNFLEFVVVLPVLAAFGISIGGLEGLQDLENWNEVALISLIAGFSSTMIVLTTIVNWLYFALMHSSNWQATLGKKALGLKVVGANYERINFTTASLRYLGKIISGMVMMIGFIIAAFTEKKQALHDLIASTYVVYDPDRSR